MNTHTTAHPDPQRDRLLVDTIPDAAVIRVGGGVSIILSERDPEAAEAWLLDASTKLADLARKVAVRAAIKAAS